MAETWHGKKRARSKVDSVKISDSDTDKKVDSDKQGNVDSDKQSNVDCDILETRGQITFFIMSYFIKLFVNIKEFIAYW